MLSPGILLALSPGTGIPLSAAARAFTLCIDSHDTFGSGTHPSTRLALDALAARVKAGTTLLDVGCGSGILALAAARLGARATGIDPDPAAVARAEANRIANRIPPFAATQHPATQHDLCASQQKHLATQHDHGAPQHPIAAPSSVHATAGAARFFPLSAVDLSTRYPASAGLASADLATADPASAPRAPSFVVPPRGFDLIVANLPARILAAASPLLAPHLAPGGTLILSGLLLHEVRALTRVFPPMPVSIPGGLRFIERSGQSGWARLVYERVAAAVTP